MLDWEEYLDENDNSYWEADSPWHDDGKSFRWRLHQSLERNRIVWYADHDDELMEGFYDSTWSDIDEAKAEVEQCHKNILNEELI